MDEWIVPRELTIKEMLTLHILALSAGYKSKGVFISNSCFNHASVRKFPGMFANQNRLFFFSHDQKGVAPHVPRISYEEAMKFFKERIKEREV